MIRLLILGAVILAALAAGAVLLAGARAPLRHVARVSAVVPASRQAVWELLGDPAGWPAWNPHIARMTRLPDRDGRAVWSMESRGDRMASEIVESIPGERLVTRIADPDLPYAGSWTWALEAEGTGTRVTITEDGLVKSVVFRGVTSLLLGYTGTQRKFLQALGSRLGATAVELTESVSFPAGNHGGGSR